MPCLPFGLGGARRRGLGGAVSPAAGLEHGALRRGLLGGGRGHLDEMGDPREHAPDVGAVGQDAAAADAAQAQGPERAPVLGLGADRPSAPG